MQDVELEVFRADTRASRGITAERLAAVAAFDCDAHPIPVVIGHPQSDSPAEGTIAGFRLDGSKLFAKLKGVTQRVVDGIKDGSLINRSMAFFHEDHEANPTAGKLAPRHLGLLGGAAPGIPGMERLDKAFSFAADDESGENLIVEGEPAAAVVFEAEPTPIVTIFEAKETPVTDTTTNTPPAKSEAELAFEARQKEFAKKVRTQFEAGNSNAIDALVRDGKVLPHEADGLKLAFNSFDPEADDLTFGAGDKQTKASAVSHLLSFMAGLGKRVPIGDRQSPSTQFQASNEYTSPLDFTAKAEKLAKDENITVEAAMTRLGEQAEQADA